ncbi:MAG: sensor domain-containing diguanylate cyclase [Pseudomonadota bacterium]
MSQPSTSDDDPRLAEILEVIFKFAVGDLTARGTLSDDDSAVDGVMAGVNTLGEELAAHAAERKRAEEQLRLASRYARSLIEASLDPLVTISVEGKIMDVNEAAVEATGVPREQLIGSDFAVYFTDPVKAHEGYEEAFTKGVARNYPLTLRHVSGRQMEVIYNASVYHTENGEIAGVLAVARDITESKRAEQAEELASRDSLTGLYNHRTFYALLEEETVRTLRFNRPVSLLMLDIDYFKAVNDTYGHQAGDVILRSLSDLLVKQARAVDRVCRYGGEEFMVILPETDAVVAMQIAERLRAEVERQLIDVGAGRTVTITVSVGVATYPQQADSVKEVVKAADLALYAAKQAGRNRVSRYAAAESGGINQLVAPRRMGPI